MAKIEERSTFTRAVDLSFSARVKVERSSILAMHASVRRPASRA